MSKQDSGLSEWVEDMKALNEHFKNARKEEAAKNSDTIKNWCAENEILFVEIQPYQIRLSNGSKGKKIDIFPQSKKYHDLTNNKRGRINTSITGFLNKFFSLAQ